jgi:hypothetical protein
MICGAHHDRRGEAKMTLVLALHAGRIARMRYTSVLFALALASAASQARADEPSPKERAAELEKKAFDAAQADQLDKAASALRAAWRLAPARTTACNLGRVEFERRRFTDAAEFLSRCTEVLLQARTEHEKARHRRHLDALAEARKHVVAVHVHVSEPGADVLLDDRPIGASPLPRVVFVEPGPHELTASLEGFERATAEIEGEAGDALDITLPLRRAPAPPAPAPVPPAPPQNVADAPAPLRPVPPLAPEPPQTPLVTPSLLGGASVATLVVGAIFAGIAVSAHDEMLSESANYKTHHGPCWPEGCNAGSSRETFLITRSVAAASFTIGGALGATYLAAFGLLPRTSASRSAQGLSTIAVW